MKPIKIDYKKFIEHYFMVIDREEQVPVPFVLNKVQGKYLEMLNREYPNQEGLREIILKARQQGFSSFILALFTADFIMRPYSVSICISHRRDSTELLFKKVRFYLESYLQKKAEEEKKIYTEETLKSWLASDNKGMITNSTNDATFYIGTAGAKVGGRGGSARNVHFSEASFYQDTEMLKAHEMILATAQQVPQGRGMIFIESTANGEGNYYHAEWERASEGKSVYKPRFFGWQEFYSTEWVEEKRKEFPSEKMAGQEYPYTPEEAFITSGSPYFNVLALNKMLDEKAEPTEYGRIAPDGHFC